MESGPPIQRNKRKRRWLVMLMSTVVGITLIVVIAGISQYVLHRIAPSPLRTGAVTVTPRTAFHAASCPFKLGDGIVEGKIVRCGYVTVPENRSLNNGRTVQVAVAIFKTAAVVVDSDPVIRLDGGPGGPSLDDWAHYITNTNFNDFVFNHDLIMFDQRGTGYSRPSLNCPEIIDLQYATLNRHLSSAESEKLQVQAARTCHDRLAKSGIDLNAYNTLENAADVRDIIQTLGYKQATLYGVSYGTRLALTVMRLYPAVIHSVVLDSVYPAQKNRTDLPSAATHAFNALFQGCAMSTKCNRHYPALETVFYKLVDDLNANPITFQTTSPYTNKSYTVVFAGDDMIFWLFSALYVTEFISELPSAIYHIRAHDYTPIRFN